MTSQTPKTCYVENDFLVCFCGKCKPEDYKLPSDFHMTTTSEEQAYNRGYEQGKFDAEMDRLNTTPDTTEIEEVVDAITKAIFMDGAKLFPSTREKVTKIIYKQIQKARHDWLREEIVKLKQEQADLRESCRGSYKIIVLTKEMEGFIDALQTIIDRYQAELDQEVSK